jgi:two-component system, OmpR family, sensor histidine kinase BaeS
MKKKQDLIKKINLLNQLAIESNLKENEVEILQNFTEIGVEILEAVYGYATYRGTNEQDYKLIYQSPGSPANIPLQKNKGKCIPIPISYGEYIHGNIVLCYKNNRQFTNEDIALSMLIGTLAAKAITIPWLIKNERRALGLAEKQKEMEVLWIQEKMKTEFTENAAHELRTPLAIMKGNVDLALLDKKNPKGAFEALEEVNNEIKILAEILENLMLINAARKDAKNILSLQPTDIVALVTKTAKRMQSVARDKKIKIDAKTSAKSLMVSGDRIYLEKLFLNLIKNAVTYGKVGGYIKVKISNEKTKEKTWAKIEVSDNGMGITREDLPRVFERFYRGDKAHTARTIHSGLGLPIAKWAAQMHGGDIEVKSTYGKGSTFTVMLPLIKK